MYYAAPVEVQYLVDTLILVSVPQGNRCHLVLLRGGSNAACSSDTQIPCVKFVYNDCNGTAVCQQCCCCKRVLIDWLAPAKCYQREP